jgi:YidC/Oxa1 family membrane protein insertase
MDTKRLITGMALAMVLIGIWYLGLAYVNRLHPDWQKALETAATQPAAPATTPQQAAVTPPANAVPTSGPTTSPAGLHAVPGDESQVAVLGSAAFDKTSKTPQYVMQVVLTARGAGIAKVTLNQFRQSVKAPDLYSFQEPYADQPDSNAMETRTLTVNGVSADADAGWTLDHSDASSATFTEEFVADSHPVVRLTKTYHLPDVQSSGNTSEGYELRVDYTIQNLADHPITVSTSFNGPTVPPKEVERGADQQVLVGYNTPGPTVKVMQHVVEEFKGAKVQQDLTHNGDDTALWAGTASVYFNALVLPDTSSRGVTKTDYAVQATNIDPDSETPTDIAMTFQTGDVKLDAAGTASLPLNVFFGPKERKLITTPYYALYPRQYNETLVIASGFCGFCTFAWLIDVLVKMLTFFHWIFGDWGIAIICLVIIVRVLLHPITKKSQVHMVKMGKMGPEMERLKKKYGDDKDALNKAMMQFYKEQGLAPVLGCLPMFLQMPIWIALWSALQSTFELRQSPFLYIHHGSEWGVHLTWIKDLANPDALISFTPIHIFSFTLSSLNILPLLLSVVFYFQQKFTPKPITTTPEQAQQQKMMTWMSTLLFPIFLYKGPAGLNLYILTSTTIGIIESKVIRDHIKQREEAEKAGRVFVDTKPTRAARRRDERDEPPKKKTGLMGWIADLQQRAEDIRRQADKGK